jgi:hypothetical protein
MGYAFMTAPCFVCKVIFCFNPIRVPSVRDSNNVRQGVCRNCVEAANVKRKELGLEPFPILDGAYEACDESELP